MVTILKGCIHNCLILVRAYFSVKVTQMNKNDKNFLTENPSDLFCSSQNQLGH